MSSKLKITLKDASRRVTVGIYEQEEEKKQYHDVKVKIDDDEMIVVGGGGKTWYVDPWDMDGNVEWHPPIGAFLTASFPDTDTWSYWQVSSKDHLVLNKHHLAAYAIGLKIDGIKRDELLTYIRHESATYGGWSQYPYAEATVRKDYILISGGFRVDWQNDPNTPSPPGNLAIASFPKSTYTWYARSKDHGMINYADIKVWAIGIKEKLPVGRVKGYIGSEQSFYPEPHPHSTVETKSGYALTGGGANVHYNGPGNLLWNLTPSAYIGEDKKIPHEFNGASKDHLYPDPSTITSYALGIKIVD